MEIKSNSEEIEGLDITSNESWGDYPLDTVFVRKDTRTVGDVMSRIDKERYILDPEFQRDFVWSSIQQQRLIESALMRIPLPVMYVAEDIDGKIIVVDGLQRLTTFYRFIHDEFSLRDIGKEGDKVIRNKKFSELPVHLQERIEDTQLTLYILDSKAPERARLDIFERVNSGVPLTRQQMRNCLYSGPATRWLRRAAESEFFLLATDRALSKRTMRDREVINRFCAFFLLGYQSYKGDMEEYLADALIEMNNSDESTRDKMFDTFSKSMKLNLEIFGKDSFRKSIAKDGFRRTVVNVSLFDALATGFAINDRFIDTKDSEIILDKVVDLLNYPPFDEAISNSTNSTLQVKVRHELVELMFGELFDEDALTVFLLDTIGRNGKISREQALAYSRQINNKFVELSEHPDWNRRDDLLAELRSIVIPISDQLRPSLPDLLTDILMTRVINYFESRQI